MRSEFVVAWSLSAALLAPLVAGLAAPGIDVQCAPPCGPIPVIITILVDKSKGVTFDAAGHFETPGKVQYYFDIDQNGYAYDPEKSIDILLKVNKQPPWVKTSVDPTKIHVPIKPSECPSCVQPEGSDAGQSMYYFEAPIKVAVERLRDPTAAELKQWTKSDGTYRVSVSATSNESMAGSPQTGTPAGLMEGYGVKEVRFASSMEKAGASPPSDAGGMAPGLGGLAFLASIAVVVGVFRRRA